LLKLHIFYFPDACGFHVAFVVLGPDRALFISTMADSPNHNSFVHLADRVANPHPANEAHDIPTGMLAHKTRIETALKPAND
jgi:hypothetical protein